MAKPKILVFQHVPYEPLGTLDPLLKALGFRIRYVNFARNPHAEVNLDRYAAIIALGGPMNADDVSNHPNLRTEVDLLKRALDRDMSVLGICLGAQLLAKALGGRVHAGGHREIGWHEVELTKPGIDDEVMGRFSPKEQVFQWHDDGIELGPDCVHLARSERCNVQAFRHGEHAYGLQFHLEVDRSLIARWLDLPLHRSFFDDPGNPLCRHTIREQSDLQVDALEKLSNSTFGQWVNRFDLPTRREALPSR